jgi:hypothetical protein
VDTFDRFDVAPVDGSRCGEYRIVFAHQNGVTNRVDPNLLIFEATSPNPTLGGAFRSHSFWSGLSSLPNITVRADRLDVELPHCQVR